MATAGRRRQLYATVLVVATAAFVVLAAAVVLWGSADELDVRFVRWVHARAPDWLVEAMRVLTHLGGGLFLGALALVVGALLVRRGRAGWALLVVGAYAGSQVLDQLLKALFRRARPELDDPFVRLSTYAFPSGHAFAATATYGAIALLVASASADRRVRVTAIAGAAAVIAVVAASRVVLGVHYLFDVVAGIAAGVAWLAALLLLLERPGRSGLRVVLFPGKGEPQRPGLHAKLER